MKRFFTFLFFTLSVTAKASPLTAKELHLPSPTPRWVVLDFWASWCGPCEKSAVFYERQFQKWKDHDVYFLGINQDDDQAAQKEWLSKHTVSFAQMFDKDHVIAHQLEVDTLPRLLIFDSKLHLVRTVRGFYSEKAESLEKDFAELFSPRNTKQKEQPHSGAKEKQ